MRLRQDEQRGGGHGLGTSAEGAVDEGLGPFARGLRHRQVDELGGDAVDRMAEAAIDSLDQEHGDEGPAGDERPDTPEEEQQRRDRDRRRHAEAAHDRAAQEQLYQQGQAVQQRVVTGEERAKTVGGYRPRHRPLEQIIDDQQAGRRQADEDRDAGEEGLVAECMEAGARRRGRPSRLDRTGLVPAHRRDRGGRSREHHSTDGNQPPDRNDDQHGRRCRRAEKTAQHPRGGDRPEQPASLRHGEHAGGEGPELRHQHRADEPGGDVEREDGRLADGNQEQRSRTAGHRDQGDQERTSGTDPDDQAGARRDRGKGERGDDEVHDGERAGRQLGQEQRVARGLEDGVGGDDEEKDDERGRGRSPLPGPYVQKPGKPRGYTAERPKHDGSLARSKTDTPFATVTDGRVVGSTRFGTI